jgi:hypothetical protein
MKYFNKSVFDNINDGNNKCDQAFRYAWAYIAGILLVFIIHIFATAISISGELARYFDPRRVPPPPLTCTRPPVFAIAVLCVFYVIAIIAKVWASYVALEAITNFTLTPTEAAAAGLYQWFPQSYFPFQTGSLDINAIMFVCVVMSVIRGYSTQSASAYRLAGSMAFVFAMTSYPTMATAYR